LGEHNGGEKKEQGGRGQRSSGLFSGYEVSVGDDHGEIHIK